MTASIRPCSRLGYKLATVIAKAQVQVRELRVLGLEIGVEDKVVASAGLKNVGVVTIPRRK